MVAIAGGRQRTDHAVQVLGADAAADYRDDAFPELLRRPRATASSCSSTTAAAASSPSPCR
ncbi:MAG TPA: hypothetical protein VGF32_27385 [Streptosporangiaceae bacterium]